LKSFALTSGAVMIASGATAPEVPWWGQLIMALVSVALAFFGGRTAAEARGR